MTSDPHLVQRLVDGALPPHEATAVERSLVDRGHGPAIASARELQGLLGATARPLSPDEHHVLLARVSEAVPRTRPQAYAKVRFIDIVSACAAAGLIAL